MELCSLYNRLGKLINLRGNIEEDITALRSKSDNLTKRQVDKLRSLEAQFNRVQHQIFDIDEEIRDYEEDMSLSQQQEPRKFITIF